MKILFMAKLLIILSMFFPLLAFAGSGEVRNQAINIEKQGALSAEAPFKFDIEVNGKSGGEMYADPPGCFFPWKQDFYNNESLSIENKGTSVVKNPWITMTGKPDLFSIQTIIQSVIPKDAGEKEKALLLYEFNRGNFFHAYLGTGDNIDPVKMFNVYGYGICGDSSVMLTALYSAAGLKTRRGRPYGHSTFESMFDGKFRYLDGDVMTVVLDSANSEIVGEEEFVTDPYLMKRTHTFGLKSWGWSESRDEVTSGLFWYGGKRTISHEIVAGHTMSCDLRPGEKITWYWKERLKPLGLFQATKDNIGKSFHGQLEYKLTKENAQAYRKDLSLVVPFHLPYPFAGISIAFPESSAKDLELSISKDGKTYKNVEIAAIGKGLIDDAFLSTLGLARQEKPAYDLWVKLTSKQPEVLSFPIVVKLDFQFAPKSMPQLHPGENVFKYRDSSDARNVAVNFTWKENSSLPPEAPSKAIFPANNSSVKGTGVFTFEWAAVKKGDGAISDYQFQLSDHPEFKWPLSSNFDVLLSFTSFKGTNKFATPQPGLLTPGIKYFWRVRARDDKGCWSQWSDTWSFMVDGPGVPLVKTPEVNQNARNLKLCWDIKGGNTKAAKYRVFGSRYRGFTPSMQALKMIVESAANVDKFGTLPPSFLFETKTPEAIISLDGSAKVFPFYRIQAVDGDGNGGCFSAQAEVPSPVLLTKSPVIAAANQTVIPLSFISSAGRLVNAEGHGYRYEICMKDDWNIQVLSCKGAADIKADGYKSNLILSRPLNKDEKVLCGIKASGSSYINYTRENTFDIIIIGGDKIADKVAAPLQAAANAVAGGTNIFKGNFDKTSLEKGGNWTVDDKRVNLEMRNIGGKWFVCGSREPGKDLNTYARISIPFKPAAENISGCKGGITVSFSAIFSVRETNYSLQIQLLKKNNDWTYLSISQWGPATLIRKTQSKAPLQVFSEKSFNFQYNVPLEFKWVISENGKQSLYLDGNLLNEWAGIPNDSYSPDNLSGVRAAFNMSLEFDKGFIGIGDLNIQLNDVK